MQNGHIYTKIQTFFKKQDTLRFVFIHNKPDTLQYVIINENFEIGIYINTKSMTPCVT